MRIWFATRKNRAQNQNANIKQPMAKKHKNPIHLMMTPLQGNGGYISIFLNDPTTSRTPETLRAFPPKEAVVRFWLTEMSREPSSDSSEELAPLVREDVEAVMRLLLLLNVM